MRCLQKWEEHVRASNEDARKERLGPPAALSHERAALQALQAWASVSSKARTALKRAGSAAVDDMELRFLEFVVKVR